MPERAYISIVRWPKGSTQEQRIEALAAAVGLDPYTARLRVNLEPPQVIARVDATVADDIVAQLKARGVAAFALTKKTMDFVRAPLLVKRMSAAEGAADPMYMVEFWKRDPAGLKMGDVFLIIRARLDRSTTRTQVETTRTDIHGAAMAVSGVQGALLASALDSPAAASRTTTFRAAHLIDLYLRDGSLIRINSEKFAYEVLGKQRGYSDAESADKLALRLASEAPQALVDTAFAKFKCPPDIARDCVRDLGAAVSRERDDTGVFDFYSVWSYCLHRLLAGPLKEGA